MCIEEEEIKKLILLLVHIIGIQQGQGSSMLLNGLRASFLCFVLDKLLSFEVT